MQEQAALWLPDEDKSRKITLESELLRKLAEWQRCRAKTRFIFGTRTDNPNGHFLEACKRTAHRAGLNCGHCAACLEKNECERWYLHKWRATFASWSLQRGVDIRTVQLMLGHTKIEITERYLAPAEGPVAQAKMNAVFAGLNTGQRKPSISLTLPKDRRQGLPPHKQGRPQRSGPVLAAAIGD